MPHILFRMEVTDGHNVEAAKDDEINHRSCNIYPCSKCMLGENIMKSLMLGL